jgi:hypothetical protein
MPNRLRYHERRLIARGLAKESDFRKSTETVSTETVSAPKVEKSSEQKEGILDKLKITKQED